MSRTNIKKNNIDPFLNKNVISNTENNLIKNILLDDLPLLPGINFYDKKDTDQIGSVIINAYYNIKVHLRKLEIIKTFIISIIKSNESYFKKISINKQVYNISERKLIIKFKDTFGQTFKQLNDIEEDIEHSNKLSESSNIAKLINRKKNYVKTSIKSYIDKSFGTNISSKKKDFPIFINQFIYNNYGLIDDNNEENPLFFIIFLKEYNGKNKLFFKTLFNKYVEIRKNLLKYLVDGNINYGILAFNFLFDLPYSKINTEIESNNKKNTNNNNNLNNYIVSNNNNISNSNTVNSDIKVKVGDIVRIKFDKKIMKNIKTRTWFEYISSWAKYLFGLIIKVGSIRSFSIDKFIDAFKVEPSKNEKDKKLDELANKILTGTIIKIDYDNPSKPYLIKFNIDVKNDDIFEKKYSEKDFEVLMKREKKLKLNQKISDNDLLYRNIIDKQTLKDNYLKNITKKYSELLESTDNFVGKISTQTFTLDDIIKNNIQVDYNLFDFIFNYVDPLLLNKVIDENYMIKDNISRHMDQFDLYYDQYIDWFNKLKGFTYNINNSDYKLNISDFERFFYKSLKDVTKNK